MVATVPVETSAMWINPFQFEPIRLESDSDLDIRRFNLPRKELLDIYVL